MALHGELKVNNHIIGDWSAVRRDAVVQSQGGLERYGMRYRYECWMLLNDYGASFWVEHNFNDGAAILLRKILYGYSLEMSVVNE